MTYISGQRPPPTACFPEPRPACALMSTCARLESRPEAAATRRLGRGVVRSYANRALFGRSTSADGYPLAARLAMPCAQMCWATRRGLGAAGSAVSRRDDRVWARGMLFLIVSWYRMPLHGTGTALGHGAVGCTWQSVPIWRACVNGEGACPLPRSGCSAATSGCCALQSSGLGAQRHAHDAPCVRR